MSRTPTCTSKEELWGTCPSLQAHPWAAATCSALGSTNQDHGGWCLNSSLYLECYHLHRQMEKKPESKHARAGISLTAGSPSSNHYSFVNNGQSSEWGNKQTAALVQPLTWVSSYRGRKLNQDCLTHSLLFCQTGPAGYNNFFPTCSWDAFGVSPGLKVTSAVGCSRGAHRQLPIHLHILAHVQQCSQKFSPQQPSGAAFSWENM